MQIHKDMRYQKLIDTMEQLHKEARLEEMKPVLEQLQTMAEREQDDIGLTAAYFYRDVLLGSSQSCEVHMRYAKRALKIAEAKNITYYKMKLSNTLGILYSEISDFHTSLEYYLSAIHIAEAHPEYCYAAIVLNNVGNLFVWLDEYAAATTYLERAYDKCIAENQDDREVAALVVLNLIEMYSNLEQYDRVKEWEDKTIVPFNEEEELVMDSINMINSARQQLNLGNIAATKDWIFAFIKNSQDTLDNVFTFRCYLNALKLGIEMNDFSICQSLVEKMDQLQTKSFMQNFAYDYINLKVQYYEAFKPLIEQKGDSYYDEYYKQCQYRITQLRNTYAKSLFVKIALEEAKDERKNVQKENVKLQKDSELDIFTNLYNKISTEKYVRMAMEKKTPEKMQALLLIDIDKFKQINDNYGHGFGDTIISGVAKIMETLDAGKKIVGRFGGDEFLIFLDEQESIDNVYAAAAALLENVQQLELPDEKIRAITLSIGICVITPEITFEKAFQAADKALYEAKESGRNCYKVQPKH